MNEFYKYHKNGDEWVIRRHHLNGYEGVGAANGETEARAICAGMNASIQLVLWDDSSGESAIDYLSEAVKSAKRSVFSMR